MWGPAHGRQILLTLSYVSSLWFLTIENKNKNKTLYSTVLYCFP